MVNGIGDHPLHCRFFSHIDCDSVGLNTQRAYVFQCLGRLLNAAGCNDDVGASVGQAHSDPQAQAAVAAGDHRDFAGQVEEVLGSHINRP